MSSNSTARDCLTGRNNETKTVMQYTADRFY
jgi:hypothetical protein